MILKLLQAAIVPNVIVHSGYTIISPQIDLKMIAVTIEAHTLRL